jgi:hypothetical protein
MGTRYRPPKKKSPYTTQDSSPTDDLQTSTGQAPDASPESLSASTSKEAFDREEAGLVIQQDTSAPFEGITISTPEQRKVYEHLVSLRNIKNRRFQHLELRAARQGDSTDPSVLMEMEDLLAELNDLERQIHRYIVTPNLLLGRENFLTLEQQQAVLQALEIMGCTFIERIRYIDIVVGSVVVVVEMPFAGAARLMALHHVKHPQLGRKGITDVKFAPDISTLERPQKNELVEAVNFEIGDLEGDEDKVSDKSPYDDIPYAIPLHITVDEEKYREGWMSVPSLLE